MAILTLDDYRNAEKQIVRFCKNANSSLTNEITDTFFNIDYDPPSGSIPTNDKTTGSYPTSSTTGMPKIKPFPVGARGYITKTEVSLAYDSTTPRGSGITLYDLLWWSGSWSATGDLTTTPDITSRLPVVNSIPDYSSVELLMISNNLILSNVPATEYVRYINQDNVENNIATFNVSTGSSDGYTTYPQLQAGDKQIKSVNGFTLGTAISSGGFNIALARRLIHIPLLMSEREKLTGIESSGICEIFENSAIFGIFRGYSHYPTINLEISML